MIYEASCHVQISDRVNPKLTRSVATVRAQVLRVAGSLPRSNIVLLFPASAASLRTGTPLAATGTDRTGRSECAGSLAWHW